MIGSTEIHRRFSFKPLNGITKLQQEAMLLFFEDLATCLDIFIEDGKYKDHVFEHLENAILWANKGISETK